MIDLNLSGTLLPIQLIAEAMAAQRAGVIINISSMAAQRTITRVVGYSAAKAAVENLTRWLAVELAAQTVQGAARMVLQTGEHPAALRDRVTTPAGCTIAGLFVMEDGKIRSTLARTIQEAAAVASGLGKG